MKNNSLIFALLLFFYADHFIAQTRPSISYTDLGGGNIEVTVDHLVLLDDDLPTFNAPAYYEGFFIAGDGNFKRIGSRALPIRNGEKFIYKYRDLKSVYPGMLCLIPRKDGDEPPGPDELLLIPPNISGNTYVNVNGSQNLNVPIVLNSIDDRKPYSPMIDDSAADWLQLGCSHSTKKVGYYLKEESVHVFPLACKPEGKSGAVWFFFYNNAPTGNNIIQEKFEYYDQITISDNSSSHNVGTIIPYYFNPNNSSSETIADVVSRMDLITDLNVSDYKITSKNIQISNTSYYDKGFFHVIQPNEVKLLTDNEITPPAGSSYQKGELRYFPFIKTPKTFYAPGTDAKFLAVLYDSKDDANVNELAVLHATVPGVSFPDSFDLFPGKGPNYKFADYTILTANKGEPDDPGGLVIESICKCCNDYIATCKLTFCNSGDASAPARRANIFLESYPIDRQSPISPLLSNITLLDDCLINSSNVCIDRNPCDPMPISGIIETPDLVYCYEFIDNGLAPGVCEAIQFSVRISASDVARLRRVPVMRYCVRFDDAPNVGEFCLTNDILWDICIQGEPDTICNPHPIFDDKNQLCQGVLYEQNNCQQWNCTSTDQGGGEH